MTGPERSMDGFRTYTDGGGLFLRLIFSGTPPAAVMLAALIPAGAAAAQERGDTVFDEAGVLTGAEEQRVQQALDEASAGTDEPHYLFFVPDEDVPRGEERKDLLRDRADGVGAPDEAGVIVVAPNDEWALVSPEVENAQGVFETMRPELQDRSYAEAAITGAERISDDATIVPEVAGFGLASLLLTAAVGGTLLARRFLRRRRELTETRRRAEDQFGLLRERMADYNEKERLVSGYLEAQRSLVAPGAAAEAEKHLNDAGGAGFGAEFTEASTLLTIDPDEALARIKKGNGLLDDALRSLDRAEDVLDRQRGISPKTSHQED